MRVETRSAAALRARVRRSGGVLGCWNGMRRTEVRVVGIGMFVVFVVFVSIVYKTWRFVKCLFC